VLLLVGLQALDDVIREVPAQRSEAAAIQQSRRLSRPLRHNMEAQFEAVSKLSSGKLQLGPPVNITLNKPFLIWTQPAAA